ncbi:hypothetical protein P5673_015118 [Acropora cervicornis]|uniref:Uncharacterized protein n=1 Tax=Acropora cervicornis TaxID=6130 RepID=A0AAD9V5R3_ACRCE|nr:hypothetical protein P5673_015118 [Acropora cervicornis]
MGPMTPPDSFTYIRYSLICIYSCSVTLSNDQNFYMDNLLKSVNDITTMSLLQQEMISLLARGGFRLNKWSKVLSWIPSHELACPTLNLDLDNLPVERTLGMKWNMVSDSLCFSVCLAQPVLTKRRILSRVSSIFEPLGVLSPCQVLNSNIMEEEKALG